MAIRNTVIVKSTKLPVNWNLLKSYLRDDFVDNNTEIEKLVKTSTNYVEKYCNISLVKQTRRMTISGQDLQDMIHLPYSPIIQVNTITGILPGGTQEVIDSVSYTLIDDILYLNFGLIYDHIVIEYECGYEDTRTIPDDLMTAVMRITANLYIMKEDISNESISVYDQTKDILKEYQKIPLI